MHIADPYQAVEFVQGKRLVMHSNAGLFSLESIATWAPRCNCRPANDCTFLLSASKGIPCLLLADFS